LNQVLSTTSTARRRVEESSSESILIIDNTTTIDQTNTINAKHKNNNNILIYYVDPRIGDNTSSGRSINTPVRTIHKAQTLARRSSASSSSSSSSTTSHPPTNKYKSTTIVLRGGRHILQKPLVLDARDNGLTIQSYRNETVIVSGGDVLRLGMRPTAWNARIYGGKLPRDRVYNFTMLFRSNDTTKTNTNNNSNRNNDDIRLVWAREPNGQPEQNLQPDGYAHANGTGTAHHWPNTTGSIHLTIQNPQRNSTIYPYFGEDLDPRGNGNWLSLGGVGNRFHDRKTFWNGTVPMGLRVREDDLNTTGWTVEGLAPAIAHVFHNDFWGNWQYRLGDINTTDRQLSFLEGGWQEGRGGGIANQPYFLEGVKEALDVPGEWWLDVPNQVLYYYMSGNETSSTTTVAEEEEEEDDDGSTSTTTKEDFVTIEFVAPRLKRLIVVMGSVDQPARNITISGITITHSATTFMDPYEVPSPGDWSIRRDGAIFIENAHHITIDRCRFLRTGGNALFLSGHVKDTRIARNEFSWIGDSAVLTVGRLELADGFTVDTFPEDTIIERNHFREIGIIGKQTSALFSALSCRTSFVFNVAYNGPRAGINLNDQFCHGHKIKDNLLFNWVRETQDHGPINTWNRAMYIQRNTTNNQPTVIPQWAHIERNFIMNGPSGNRNLGNLFPTIDNDDGSSYFYIANNFLVYGGAKNYLGHDKVWISNLFVYPGRWSGDPCGMLWGGKNHHFENNTCVVAPGNEPIGLDGSIEGSACKIDWNDVDNLEFVGRTADNVYYIDNEWKFECGNGTASSHYFTMKEMQKNGWETGSVVKDSKNLRVDSIIDQAKTLLSN